MLYTHINIISSIIHIIVVFRCGFSGCRRLEFARLRREGLSSKNCELS